MKTTKRNAPELSVIVPVYKVEAYLQECIDSILDQTFPDFELILIDDGSPDRCPEICDEAARKDPRIRVIHQKNGGLSAARNAGIEAAQGAWLSFIDSDDYLTPDYYETLYGAVQRANADCALCGVEYVDEQKNVLEEMRAEVPDGVFSGQQILDQCVQKWESPYIVVWNKLYRREVFDTLRFPVGKLNEDLFVLVPTLEKIQTMVCVPKRMYCYRQRAGSIMNSQMTSRNLDQGWGYYQCFQYFYEHGMKDLLASAESRIFTNVAGVYYKLSPEERHSQEVKAARKMQWDAVKCLYREKCLSGRTLIRTILFQAVPRLYGIRRIVYEKAMGFNKE